MNLRFASLIVFLCAFANCLPVEGGSDGVSGKSSVRSALAVAMSLANQYGVRDRKRLRRSQVPPRPT
jgi:hypothetical protein